MKVKELKRNFVRRIALVGDMHLGSRYALCPSSFKSQAGTVTLPNKGQKQIYESFQKFCEICDQWDIDTVFLLGDLIHGQNPYERGTGLMTTDLNEQIDLLQETLKLLVWGRKTFWVSGSRYHRSTQGMNIEIEAEKRFRESGITKQSKWLGDVGNLRIKNVDKIINLSHGGGRAAYYRETIIAREIIYGKASHVDEKLPKIDFYIHGHWHWFNHLHQRGVHHIQVPCWMAYEPISLYTPNYVRYQPDIGGVLLLFDETGRAVIWHYLYPVPHIADEVVSI